ncbi:MAG: alpha-L-rhamnosidase N-terminal domain-containing protein [Eubacterium sp.]|nr:alpha-L-rhamnosidase N-terminal domain-containing protein [Eubacterium sp.]
MNKIISFILALASLLSGVIGGGNAGRYFKNEYTVPEELPPYVQLDTKAKTDWSAEYIWDSSDAGEENVWMCLRKSVELTEAPKKLTAYISADSKYLLYINGETAVSDGGVKRGPTESGSYYDTVEIGSYLKSGKNVICALVWYWGKDKSFSSTDSGKGGFLFEAGSIISDKSWKVRRNAAYLKDSFLSKPNYRLPESNINYDARKEAGNWLDADFDDSEWEAACEYGKGGSSPWGELYPRGIPMLKDYGLKDYENSGEYKGVTTKTGKTVTLGIPYNAQCTPYFKIEAKAGRKIRIFTENTWLGAVSDTYITKDGVQEFEAPGWFNGQHITYSFPAGVKILELKYRETGYNTEFSGIYECNDERLNALWQKSLRTLYVTMRDNFMDCPDRERAQWWGDVTNEMAMSMYALDANSYLLYQKGVASMLGHIDKDTKVLQTVVPTGEALFELPVQQLAGICGFWTYYLYTGDAEFLNKVYDASVNYINLWKINENGLVVHREGSWDWMDWGSRADVTAIENAWYYYALSSIHNMAEALGRNSGGITDKMDKIKRGYEALWTDSGYKSDGVKKPDDRANALAVLSGLAEKEKYGVITTVLKETENASPYMEYYVLEALCKMDEYGAAKERMLRRYEKMTDDGGSTLWEKWNKYTGTQNHAWSGGALVIMSKYFSGIRPTKAGYSEFVIRPQLENGDTVNCVVPSVKGIIRVTESRTDGAFSLDASVPENTGAIIYLPFSDSQRVTLNGKTVYRNKRFTGTKGITFVEAENGYIAFSVKADGLKELHFKTAY